MTLSCAHGCGKTIEAEASVYVCGACKTTPEQRCANADCSVLYPHPEHALPPDPDETFRSRVAALLREIEWGGAAEGCAACGSYGLASKHEPDCALAALLAEAEGT